MSFLELRRHLAARELLGRQIADKTLWEWWTYAIRRGLLEPRGLLGADEFGLTAEGRIGLEARRVETAVEIVPAARRFVREVPPASWLTLGISTAALAVASAAAVGVVIALVLAVLMAYPALALLEWAWLRRADARLDRRILARQVAWLEGDALDRWLWKPALPAVDGAEMRRLSSPPMPELPDQ